MKTFAELYKEIEQYNKENNTGIFTTSLYWIHNSCRLHSIDSELLRRCGHFYTLYNDFKDFADNFHQWVLSRYSEWGKIADVLCSTYNPISNYDKTEEHRVKRDSESSGESSDINEAHGNSANTGQVVGYNSSTFANKDRNVVDSSVNGTRSGNSSGRTESNYTGDFRTYGNIGVTTTQAMIREEIDLRGYDLVEAICNEFKKEFCIMVY